MGYAVSAAGDTIDAASDALLWAAGTMSIKTRCRQDTLGRPSADGYTDSQTPAMSAFRMASDQAF